LQLTELGLTGCLGLTEVPESIVELHQLVELHLTECPRLQPYPTWLQRYVTLVEQRGQSSEQQADYKEINVIFWP
jgi:hypothetical protein